MGAAVLWRRQEGAAGRVLRQRTRRRQRRVVVAHACGLRRGNRRVGAERHEGLDHQRWYRRCARRGRRGRAGTEGPWSGQLHRSARHQGPQHGPEVQEARHSCIAHLGSGARRLPHPRSLPARWQGEARCQAGPCPRTRSQWREAAGDEHVRGHSAQRGRTGARHRPCGLRVRARLREGAQDVRQADRATSGDRVQAGQHGHGDRCRSSAHLACRLDGP
ncbi:unannotated protein [freshwater metagenome]|uniref:Unannotated protein n=1 Tax=freshwater metagenome TaxID=449393 RepID=A0A6J6ZEM2_9ZZZZ